MLEDMCVDIAVYRRAAAATRIQARMRGFLGRVKAWNAFLYALAIEISLGRNVYHTAKQAHIWDDSGEGGGSGELSYTGRQDRRPHRHTLSGDL